MSVANRSTLYGFSLFALAFLSEKSVAGEAPIVGYGTITCAEFTSQIRYSEHGPSNEFIFFSWAQGYMSSAAENDTIKAEDFLAGVEHGERPNLFALSPDKQMARIRKFCDTHPQEPYRNAVQDLLSSLPSK